MLQSVQEPLLIIRIDPAVKDPDNPSRVLYERQPTHGKGSIANPSSPLHPSRDLQGNQRLQNFVPAPSVDIFIIVYKMSFLFLIKGTVSRTSSAMGTNP